MITPDIINRINELAKKQRAGSLTDEEKIEQANLRRLYIDNIKGQVRSYFDAAKSNSHSSNCNCGCNNKH